MSTIDSTTAEHDIPRRALRADFTDQTLHRARTAKQRAITKHNIKGVFSMKKPLQFVRTASGAAITLAVVASSSVGAYALTNWFGANVSVTQDATIIHVDLSQCKGNLPPGVEGTNHRDVEFKITGEPHISATDLQQRLLIDCENNAVNAFYNSGAPYSAEPKYALMPATIMGINGDTLTVSYNMFTTKLKTFTLASTQPVYDAGNATSLTDFHVGDHIQFAISYADVSDGKVLEGTDPYAAATVQSIFKTQYDTSKADGTSKMNDIYSGTNVMPLDLYNQQHK